MSTIRSLGTTCECGLMPTCREVYWPDIELWDNYCESCYIWHCWKQHQPYIPFNDTVAVPIEGESHAFELGDYIVGLYHSGRIDFPVHHLVRGKNRPEQILTIIKSNPGIMAHQLSLHLGYRGQSSLYRHTTPLVKSGAIRLERSKEDARKSRYYINES